MVLKCFFLFFFPVFVRCLNFTALCDLLSVIVFYTYRYTQSYINHLYTVYREKK